MPHSAISGSTVMQNDGRAIADDRVVNPDAGAINPHGGTVTRSAPSLSVIAAVMLRARHGESLANSGYGHRSASGRK